MKELENLKGLLEDNKVQLTEEQIKAINAATSAGLSLRNDTELPALGNDEVTDGLILDNKVIEELNAPKIIENPAGVTSETMCNIEAYMNEMEEEAELVRDELLSTVGEDVIEEIEKGNIQKPVEELDEDEQFNKEYNDNIVVIEKSGMGVIEFTDEEKNKIEKAKVIKLKEIEEVSLESIKIKKKKKSLGKILNKTKNTIKVSNIVLPTSGYTAEIRGCSSYELFELLNDTKDAVNDAKAKWGLIYSKLENTSLGKFKDFDDFLDNTSTLDYNVFVYGILCATYPDIDSVPLICQKCKKEFEHSYSIKSLIRAESIGEKLSNIIADTIDAAISIDSSKKHKLDKAPMSEVLRFKLPQSEIVVEIYIQSAKDFIYDSASKLKDIEDRFAQAGAISTMIKSFLILDEDDGEYFEIDSVMEKVEVIYSLNDIDLKVLNTKISEMVDGKQIPFGFMDMNCPHCKNHVNSLNMDVEKILFFKYQKAMDTEIE